MSDGAESKQPHLGGRLGGGSQSPSQRRERAVTPMRGREVESLNFLFGLIGEAKRGEKSLGVRLQTIGRLSQYKRIVTELAKILRELLETVPVDKVARLRFGLDHQAVRIVTRNDPAVTDMLWAPADAIYGILNEVCYGKCILDMPRDQAVRVIDALMQDWMYWLKRAGELYILEKRRTDDEERDRHGAIPETAGNPAGNGRADP